MTTVNSIVTRIQEAGQKIDEINPLHSRVQVPLDQFFKDRIEPYLPSSHPEKAEKPNFLDRVNLVLDYTPKDRPIVIQGGDYLLKLIPRVIRSVASLLYHTVYYTVKFLNHPLVVLAEVVEFLGKIVVALTTPQFYTAAGAGFIGASVGQGIITPQGTLALFIGLSLIGFGLLYGTLRAAATAEKGHEWEAVKNQFTKQVKDLPEMFLVGLLIGLMVGGLSTAHVVSEDSVGGQFIGLADDIQPCISSTSDWSCATL